MDKDQVVRTIAGPVLLRERVPHPFRSGDSLRALVSAFEKKLIVEALEHTGWVKGRAARLLKVNRTTLIAKMKRLGLNPPAPDPRRAA